MPESEGVFQNRKVQFVLGIVGVIGLITLLSKMFGKSETEQKAQSSREMMYKKIPPSFTDADYADAAEILAGALAEGVTENEQAVYDVFKRIKNISDVYKLIEFYDTHRIEFEIGGSSLPNTIVKLFSKSERKVLNDILKYKGIEYEF